MLEDNVRLDANGCRLFGIFAKLSELNIFDGAAVDIYGEGLAAFYNRMAYDYVSDIPLYEKLLPKDNPTVLDLACGSGRIAIALAKRGVSVDGLELSPHMLDLVSENLDQENQQLRDKLNFVQGDMCNFSLPNRYDLIILGTTSITLLLEKSQRQSLFRNVVAHLKPGGKFIFDIVDFSGDRWKKFDNYMDVWSREVDTGQDFGIVGQRLFPDEKLFSFNVYREFVAWNGETSRVIGSSTKAWLERGELIIEIKECGLELIDEFHQADNQYFVSALPNSF